MADRPDGFDFRKDGTILCFIDGEQRKLRRPKTGEYKALRLAVRDRDDQTNALTSEAQKLLAAAMPPPAEEGDAAPKQTPAQKEAAVEALEAFRAKQREASDLQEELDRQWFGLVFNGDGAGLTALSDKPLPDDRDEWPVWLWQAGNVTKMLDHWRTDPLGLGSR